ncbi:hypothetical protein DAPPUDRAFT_250580 [Daphnia pulex]|uniref:Uncharacterized protein n=1 Tax=Daphnia pulex TaxID=6669 RepID=E9GYV8_DAPPU|nr:hypothetical protein DAPPUDRAFT_250580 [Daphnia pulex]|eukprot:EFX75340.1 hypothetical protein DAPPUDRAFT_250580 [Daphnia pulex]
MFACTKTGNLDETNVLHPFLNWRYYIHSGKQHWIESDKKSYRGLDIEVARLNLEVPLWRQERMMKQEQIFPVLSLHGLPILNDSNIRRGQSEKKKDKLSLLVETTTDMESDEEETVDT